MSSIDFTDNHSAAYRIWKNRGFDPVAGKQYEMKDLLTTSNAPIWVPKVITRIVKEAAEPLMIGSSLLQKINIPFGQQIQFSSMGALTAEDIPEGGEYPEQSLNEGPGSTIMLSTQKAGLAVKVTEEMIRYAQFDVINEILRQAGKALARHKEQKIWRLIENQGTIVFDNTNTTSSVIGATSGRSMTGAQNGSLTMDDIFDAYAVMLQDGFMPDTLIMHPLTWAMFVKDPVLRSFVLQGNGGTFFASWNGNPSGSNYPWGDPMGLGPMTQGPMRLGTSANPDDATSAVTDFDQTLNSAPVLPTYWGTPMSILVSPFVSFDPVAKTTSIYMCQHSELGYIGQSEELTTDEFTDPARDIRKIKLKERYGLALKNEGKGVAVFRNIYLRPNEVILPATAKIDIAGSIGEIDRTTPIS